MLEKLNNIAASEWTTLILVAFIIGLAFVVSRYTKNTFRDHLDRQAEKRNGTVQASGMFSMSSLVIPRQGKNMTVFAASKKRSEPSNMYLEYPVQKSSGRLIRVIPGTRLQDNETDLEKVMPTDNPTFDMAFTVRTNDEVFTRKFLTADVQGSLLRMRELKPVITLGDNRFVFSIAGIPDDELQYDRFIDEGEMLIQRIEEIS